jgi:hypothetical protein
MSNKENRDIIKKVLNDYVDEKEMFDIVKHMQFHKLETPKYLALKPQTSILYNKLVDIIKNIIPHNENSKLIDIARELKKLYVDDYKLDGVDEMLQQYIEKVGFGGIPNNDIKDYQRIINSTAEVGFNMDRDKEIKENGILSIEDFRNTILIYLSVINKVSISKKEEYTLGDLERFEEWKREEKKQ